MDSLKCLAYLMIIDVSLCSISSKTTELRVNLTADYDMNVRPGLDSDSPLVINIAMNLVALTKLNEVERYISTVQFFDITWNDERMSWKPELYENVSHLSFPSGNVWTPELIIANSADRVYSFNYDPWTVHFNHTGLAFWRPGLVSKKGTSRQRPGKHYAILKRRLIRLTNIIAILVLFFGMRYLLM